MYIYKISMNILDQATTVCFPYFLSLVLSHYSHSYIILSNMRSFFHSIFLSR